MKGSLIKFSGVLLLVFTYACQKDPSLTRTEESFQNEIEIVNELDVSENGEEENNENQEPEPEKKKIQFTVNGIQSSSGRINIAIFDNSVDFGAEVPLVGSILEFQGSSVSGYFENLPSGSYAISCYHDKNMNEKLDKNFLGIPTEGFGFSNNPPIGFGAPTFSEVQFLFDDTEDLKVNIDLKHL